MLPFHVTKMWGLERTHGYVLVNEQGIKLIFRDAADIKAKPEEEADALAITWDNLAKLQIERGYLTDAMTLQVHRAVGDEPDGTNDNEIKLELAKRDRPELDRFEQHVQEYQTGRRRDDVDDVLDDVRDFLDRM